MYVCLSSECNKHKMSEIGEFCEDDIAFMDCFLDKNGLMMTC